MGRHDEFCPHIFHLFILSYWLCDNEKGLDGSLSDCSLGFGCKTSYGNQEYCHLFKIIFCLTPKNVSFCFAVVIHDNKLLFSPHWNAATPTVRTRIERCHRPCSYYSNFSAALRCVMINDIVFKRNPGLDGLPRRHPNNLILVERNGLSPNENKALKICSLNVRSWMNKSAAFVDLVSDLKADLCTICDSWLTVNDCTIRKELTLSGYITLGLCPRSNRMVDGTVLLVRNVCVVNKISCIKRSSFEASEWMEVYETSRLRMIVVYRPPYSPDHPVSTTVSLG